MQAWEGWLKAAQDQVQLPPVRPRMPLRANGEVIGSVEAEFPLPFAGYGNTDGHSLLLNSERSTWDIVGDVSAALAQLARALHGAGLSGTWRNELLSVRNSQGHTVGAIERAAVRPLGIATQAVHLVGFTPSGKIWVQQRALDKANDPGLWDTLMGGMVSAQDSLEQALARETWEEAGLHMAQLTQIRHGGHIDFARPAHDGGGAGYLLERIDWYTATVPDQVMPVNQDGEVAQFACLPADGVLNLMGQGLFTIEAGLILAAAMDLQKT